MQLYPDQDIKSMRKKVNQVRANLKNVLLADQSLSMDQACLKVIENYQSTQIKAIKGKAIKEK